MASPNDPPIPAGDVEPGSLRMTDPKTGKPVPVADMRAEFERLSRQVPRDPEAERAFIESKIAMVQNDPNLSAADKKRAIDELRRRL
jgi:hypothetical protein